VRVAPLLLTTRGVPITGGRFPPHIREDALSLSPKIPRATLFGIPCGFTPTPENLPPQGFPLRGLTIPPPENI